MATAKGKEKMEALARLPVVYDPEAVAAPFNTDRESLPPCPVLRIFAVL